ncbi:ferredoxin [Acidaminococcus sp. NSJ-142]|jgi:ferredoxin|uniref:ferredoxin n=1 Tax=Acidaminococcus TaxID=904 RepID=UPI000CF88726|nr:MULTISPECIES: ferredoxin [Acidaminococcus]MCD2434584.1 ferredoxin [Acidaminococcus hominis]MCH4096974.1 ferredoxin [Acidaminococcus provencensis]RHK03858.1 ferredoxin [Acidaminococcus sp. AM05-11]
MKFKVNENCIGCGLCEGTCPAVFHMTDAGVAEAIPDAVPADQEGAAQDAMNGCPAGAIEQVD